MQRLKMPDGEAIEHPMRQPLDRKGAQRASKSRNFDIRKHLLEYDDVANDQRQRDLPSIAQRGAARVRPTSPRRMQPTIRAASNRTRLITQLHAAGRRRGTMGHSRPLKRRWRRDLQLDLRSSNGRRSPIWTRTNCARASSTWRTRNTRPRAAQVDPQAMRQFERAIMLQSVDSHWREHLAALDHLRQGIHLRSYAQKTPTQEYKKEAFELFSLMLDMINTEVTKILLTVRCARGRTAKSMPEERPRTCSTITPITGRRSSRRTPTSPRPTQGRLRAPATRSDATIHAHADRVRNTSTATAG